MKKILCVLLLFVIGCTPKTTMIEIQKHVYVEKEFKDSWLEMNEFGDSYIKEELQGGYGYSYDDQYLEIFFNSGGKIELYNYSIKKDNLIISGEMIPPATIRLVHPHLENVTSEGVIIHELGHYFDEKYHFSSSKQIIKIYKENNYDNKSMQIKVTDQKLIEKTGGIIQGMSGSPIIQNGKFVGAVTHVLVNNPQEGYAVFGDIMLKQSKSVQQ